MNSFDELRDSFGIPEVNERNYWFVRTESGTYFDDFYNNDYISINWEYLTPDVMVKDAEGNLDEIFIKKLIAQKEGRTLEPLYSEEDFEKLSPDKQESEKLRLKTDKKHVTGIYNKIHRFLFELQPNDIVIVPSRNSDFIAIGKIISDVYIDDGYISKFKQRLDLPEYDPCPYQKRRKVQWYKKISHASLDIYLQNALRPQQAITSLNEYAPYINRNIYEIYSQGEYLHSTFRTFQEGDLTLAQLTDFTNALSSQIEIINENSQTQISAKDIKIKINVHCPGMIEIIGAGIAGGVTILGFIVTYVVHKYGGKNSLKTILGTEFTFETKGKEGIRIEDRKLDIENRKLDLIEKQLNLFERFLENPDYKEKLDSLSSLNLQVPPIYLKNEQDEKAE